MRRTRLTAMIVTAGVCLVWAIAGAAADGGPGPGISIAGSGVTGPGGQLRYVTLPTATATVLEAIRTRDGAVLRWATIPGTFGIPLVAFDGSGGGLSRDLKTLVLASPPGPPGLAMGPGTRFAVVDTRTLKTRAVVDLPGGYSYDALSPDASTLYLIQYTSARNVNRYRVRAYDVVARRLLAGAIVDRREPGPMTGSPMTRATSLDGRWAYTLYSRPSGRPFVHALDTVGRRAVCIDLPWRDRKNAIWGVRLTLSDGRLVLSRRGVGTLALVDLRTYGVRTVRPLASGTRS